MAETNGGQANLKKGMKNGADFDRVVNHTDGSPTQRINYAGAVGLPIPIIVIEMADPATAQALEIEQQRPALVEFTSPSPNRIKPPAPSEQPLVRPATGAGVTVA